MSKSKKLVSLVLAVLLVAVAVPMAALAAASSLPTADNGVITLTEDVELATTYVVTSDTVTIDLKGHTLTCPTSGNGIEVKGGTLTIKDSTNPQPAVADGYTVTYSGGKITSSTDARNTSAIFVESGALIVEGGQIHSQKGNAVGVRSNNSSPSVTINGGYLSGQESGVVLMNNGASLKVTGGVIEARDNAAISNNGSRGAGGTAATIEGGTVIGKITTPGYIAMGIYWPNSENLSISGGKVVGVDGVGIVARAGKVEVSGDAEIIGTGDGKTTGKAGDSSIQIPDGGGIVFDASAKYPSMDTESTVEITGGTISAADGVDTIKYIPVADFTSAPEQPFNISGGTLVGKTDGIDEYLAPGLGVNDDGTVGTRQVTAVYTPESVSGPRSKYFYGKLEFSNLVEDHYYLISFENPVAGKFEGKTPRTCHVEKADESGTITVPCQSVLAVLLFDVTGGSDFEITATNLANPLVEKVETDGTHTGKPVTELTP